MAIRENLITEYFNIYNVRNNKTSFTKNYHRMSELWLDFSDEERALINRRLVQRTSYWWYH